MAISSRNPISISVRKWIISHGRMFWTGRFSSLMCCHGLGSFLSFVVPLSDLASSSVGSGVPHITSRFITARERMSLFPEALSRLPLLLAQNWVTCKGNRTPLDQIKPTPGVGGRTRNGGNGYLSKIRSLLGRIRRAMG